MTQERLNRHQRPIVKRIIVRGTLILDTPTCLGSGDTDSPTDLPLLRDSISDRALLTGSSIAGSLRNYLHEYEQGYGKSEIRQGLATKLFGHLFRYEGDDPKEEENQSPLIIDDAISSTIPSIELRDGVKIDGATGTAEDGAKYDLELLEAGTEFFLNFELLIEKDEADLKKALALALKGLEKGEICLGLKKRRGFGRCHVEKWQVWEFDLQKHKDRIEWLKFDHWTRELSNKRKSFESIVVALGGVSLKQQIDQRDRFTIHATFKLVGSLLIRSGQAATGRAPDVVHLKSHRPQHSNQEIEDSSEKNKHKLVHVLSGTSLAGVLRHRAERIVKTLGSCSPIVEHLFGFVNGKQSQASRLVVHEKVIKNTAELVQTRIAIDRFTGGAYHGALFDEQPIFGSNETIVTIELELRNPEQQEIGLLLLLLKDLWTEDLPVGGGSSVGRGRLQGIKADLIWTKEQKSWKIAQPDLSKNSLEITGSDRQDLENYVNRLVEYAQQETTKNDQA
ncbi:RAMP superfamily CRISPR-associated protein [Limnoraphis robusta Tam1]|uniref:RAMP superfamily CRISPR-associated protein n=1 Tax=Limnoraphis robusta TaxID=1118279 RepID=UPI002B1F5A93|nr:RAMP superfamily CRISPR-associated protein [Limnoraphis robusta]MEA5498947.1 RAMP superfamily CRISPR-associated protein [Limnoraphis robusta BA-68 BA1]MEA5539451.1 RAMP superfamily CRISPR-associated protein [Limnoraphis robusta Tam1]